MERRILLVEDEPGLVMTLGDRLRGEGHHVESAGDGQTGLDMASGRTYDLIVLDLMLPRKNGMDVCRDLRQRGVPTPILMLTARGQTADKVIGLKIGADDYLTKPFEMPELLARVEALLRRAPALGAAGEIYQFGAIRLDVRRTEVTRNGKPVTLSAKEFQLLRYLAEHRGTTVSRETLLSEVWGYGGVTSSRTVDVHIAWLRQKLEEDSHQPQWILTVHGMGYRLSG
ncbi:MAG: response regulator transcription factor [Bryobacteraceae bacterium]|jgi:two-component system alkaline phosphatase synthesis response regulator PhoP